MDLIQKIRGFTGWVVVGLCGVTSGMAAPVAQTIPFSNGFEYAQGTQVSSLTNVGWEASSPLVVVQTNVFTNGAAAAEIPATMMLSNAIVVAAQTNLWTDCYLRLEPVFDLSTPSVNSNAVAHVKLDSTGYLLAYDRTNGWLTLSNTTWGAPVTAVADGQWVRVTVFQNYVSQQCAVFLNGLLLKERLPFVSNVTACSSFQVEGGSMTSSYLDDFGISRTNSATLSNDWNTDGLTDASEIGTYGYLAFTLQVGPSQTYTTIQAAVEAALPRYTVNVAAGTYNENVSLLQSLASLTGGAFTINGSLSIGAGAVVNTRGLTCGTLSVSNAAHLTVAGALVATHLTIAAGGSLVITNGSLQADGLVMSGSFTVDERWGQQASSTLTFQDNFDNYQVGTPLSALGFRGWGASDSRVVVETNRANSVANGVDIGYGMTLSNRVDAGAATQVWTDFRGILCYDLLDDPRSVESGAAFMMVVSSNGYLNLYNRVSESWEECRSNVWKQPVAPLVNGEWTRISVNNNYATKECAVFLNGVLVRQKLPFINTTLTHYASVLLLNDETNAACLDDIYIGAVYPTSLNSDSNQNGVADAQEIQMGIDILTTGSVYLIR